MGVIEAHNVQVLGRGEQKVVLCNGNGTDQSIWKYVVPYLLENDYSVILYDNMGAGTTNPEYFDFAKYSNIEGFVSDLVAILDELKVTSCIFVGHSLMSMVGAVASISHPNLFSKLIFLSSTPRLLSDENYLGGFDEEDVKQVLEGLHYNYNEWCLGYAPTALGCDMDSEAAQELCRTLFNMRPDISLSLAQFMFLCDMRNILPMVTVPCHILQSEMDKVVPVEVSKYLHEHLAGPSIVELMPATGHLPHLSSPSVVIPHILKHLRLQLPVKPMFSMQMFF